ncbi:MAG: hypothetical protein SWH78_05905 [Thermodesulfobacteriota bacterium]|nr:hypothetical protein [Thermodesulfobacteriota bacterium]
METVNESEPVAVLQAHGLTFGVAPICQGGQTDRPQGLYTQME